MPLDFGARQVISENYAEFLDAARALADPGKVEQRAGYSGQDAARTRAPAIVAPGWDDIVVLGPRPTITKDMWREHFRAVRTGTVPQLSPEARSEINRKLRTRDRMENSPTPAWNREFTKALTAIDNVQDLLSTVALVGRFVLRPLITRAPVIGTPLMLLQAAATGLNMLGLLGMALTPAYGLLCGGGGDALAAGVITAIRGRALKQLVTGISKGNRKSRNVAKIGGYFKGAARAADLDAARSAARTGSSFAGWLGPERKLRSGAIEGVQVTKDLFGWGIALGGPMGLVTDAAFGAKLGYEGKETQLRTPRDPHVYYRLLQPVIDRFDDDAMVDARNAAMVMAWAPWLLDPDCPIDDHDRQQILYAHYCAIEFLEPILSDPAAGLCLDAALADSWSPPVYRYTDTVGTLEQLGAIATPAVNAWPDPNGSIRISGEQLVELHREQAARYWDAVDLIPPERPERAALELLTTRVMERTATVMLGDEQAVTWAGVDFWMLAEGLVDCSTYLDVQTHPDRVLNLLADFSEQYQRGGKVLRTRADWLALGNTHGVQMFPLIDAPSS